VREGRAIILLFFDRTLERVEAKSLAKIVKKGRDCGVNFWLKGTKLVAFNLFKKIFFKQLHRLPHHNTPTTASSAAVVPAVIPRVL